MNNVAFVRTQIELIHHIFAENEVSEILNVFSELQAPIKLVFIIVQKRINTRFFAAGKLTY